MNNRWIPFLVTTAALALAAVAPAQSRGRSRGGGGGGESRPARSQPSRSEPSRSEPTRREPSRSEPSRREPTRTESGRGDSSRPSRSDDRRDGDRLPTSTGRPTRSDDNRPSRDDNRPSRDGDRPSRNGSLPDFGRRNPFEGRDGGDRTRNDASFPRGGRTNAPSRDRTDNFNRARSYDGRSSDRGALRPVRYNPAPGRVSIGEQIRRTRGTVVNRNSSSFAVGGVFGGLRIGYVSYGNNWGRYGGGYFGYSHYVYDPFLPDIYCVASPWYRYSYLPPYIDRTQVIVVHDYPNWTSDGWGAYDYRYDAADRRNEALSDALDDLRDAFDRNSTRYAERLVPTEGQIAIFNDGKYDYSIGPDDFDKMFLDGIEQSKTLKYEITEVRTRGDEVHVRARHEFEDSWGETQVAYHVFTLRQERGGYYVIREFGTE